MEIKFPEGFARAKFMFREHVLPIGVMPDLLSAHALWYYLRIAHKSLKRMDEGGVYEGENDIGNMLNNLIQSVATLYEVDPSDMLRFMPYAKVEAERVGNPWDLRVENPGGFTFVRIHN